MRSSPSLAGKATTPSLSVQGAQGLSTAAAARAPSVAATARSTRGATRASTHPKRLAFPPPTMSRSATRVDATEAATTSTAAARGSTADSAPPLARSPFSFLSKRSLVNVEGVRA